MNPRSFIGVIQEMAEYVLAPIFPVWIDALQSVATLFSAEMDKYVDSRIEAKLAERDRVDD